MCTKQTAVSHSSTESEIVSRDGLFANGRYPCSFFFFFFEETRIRAKGADCETKPTSGADVQKSWRGSREASARQNESMLCHLKQTPATWRQIQKAHERNHAELPT